MPDRELHTDRLRAGSFGEVAVQYDRARPTYPSELIGLLCERGPRDVLDVGCGTGIAARPFVERGCRVLGVEPDERMADVARDSGLDVEVATFEDWEPRGRTFDLVFSAQAWHWIAPEVGVAKAAEIIVADGTLALFWNVGKPAGEARDALDGCYRRLAPELMGQSVLSGHGGSDRVTESTTAIEVDHRFMESRIVSFVHSVIYTTAQWLELLETHSDHRRLSSERRASLFSAIGTEIDRLGGALELPYETVCVLARRSR